MTDRPLGPGKETGVEAEINVIGIPGGGLVGASWAASEEVAEVGRRGELLTAAVLDRLAHPEGPTVLHDLLLSGVWGVRVNVDHVVVSGRRMVAGRLEVLAARPVLDRVGPNPPGTDPRLPRRQARRSSRGAGPGAPPPGLSGEGGRAVVCGLAVRESDCRSAVGSLVPAGCRAGDDRPSVRPQSGPTSRRRPCGSRDSFGSAAARGFASRSAGQACGGSTISLQGTGSSTGPLAGGRRRGV